MNGKKLTPVILQTMSLMGIQNDLEDETDQDDDDVAVEEFPTIKQALDGIKKAIR